MGQSSAERWLLWVELASTTNPDHEKKTVLIVGLLHSSVVWEQAAWQEPKPDESVSIFVPRWQDSRDYEVPVRRSLRLATLVPIEKFESRLSLRQRTAKLPRAWTLALLLDPARVDFEAEPRPGR